MSYKLNNMFYADEIDIDKFDYPMVKVMLWNQISGERGRLGNFSVEPPTNKKAPYLYLRIKEYPVYVGDDQKLIHKKAKACAKRFNRDLKRNWNRVLLRAFKDLLQYYRSKNNKSIIEEDKHPIPLLIKNINKLTEYIK